MVKIQVIWDNTNVTLLRKWNGNPYKRILRTINRNKVLWKLSRLISNFCNDINETYHLVFACVDGQNLCYLSVVELRISEQSDEW